jgi:hypothetical protein
MTGKRRWILLGPKEASYMKTDLEVLAEMPTEAILREADRRLRLAGYSLRQAVVEEGSE